MQLLLHSEFHKPNPVAFFRLSRASCNFRIIVFFFELGRWTWTSNLDSTGQNTTIKIKAIFDAGRWSKIIPYIDVFRLQILFVFVNLKWFKNDMLARLPYKFTFLSIKYSMLDTDSIFRHHVYGNFSRLMQWDKANCNDVPILVALQFERMGSLIIFISIFIEQSIS